VHVNASDGAAGGPGIAPAARATWLFAILFALMAVDFFDRQIVVSMFPHLRAQWPLSDRELGALVSIVPAVVALATLPLSWLADRGSRLRAVALMAFVWSAATHACGFATDYAHMLSLRGIVGLGEAAYGTVAAAILATAFPPRRRSMMLAAFLAAAVFGSVLGVALGGVIATRVGWRCAFFVAGVPGIVLACVTLALARRWKDFDRDPATPSGAPMPLRSVVRAVAQSRTLQLASLGQGAQLLVAATVLAWMPTYLARYHALPPDAAALAAAGLLLAGGAGSVAIGAFADQSARRRPGRRLAVAVVVALITASCLAIGFGVLEPGVASLALIAIGILTMTGTLGPVVAVAVEVAPVALRATFAAVLAFVQGIVGLAAGPYLAGALSDRVGLAAAMTAISLACVAAAALFALALRSYPLDARPMDVDGGRLSSASSR
jgi:MFS family permease